MANKVYEKDQEGQRAYHPPNMDPLDNQAAGNPSDPRSHLQDAEQASGLYNPNGDSGDDTKKSYDPSNIKGREQFTDSNSRYNAGGSQNRNTGDSGLYNPGGDQDVGFSRVKGGLQNMRGKMRKASKNKLLMGGFAVGGGGLLMVLFILVMIAGSLKIPNLAQHIAEYQFARVLRQFSETSKKITYEKLAIDSVDNAAHARMKADYQNVRNNTWGKLDKYRPNQVIKNMKGSEKTLKFNYADPSITGRQRLQSVTLNGQTYNVKNQGYTRFIPGISGAIEFRDNLAFSREFAPVVTESLKTNKLGPVVRGQVAKKIRQELGIGLVAWTAGKYAGKDAAKARLQVERDANKAIAKEGITPSKTSTVNAATEEVDKIKKEVLASDEKLTTTINNGGLSPEVVDAVEKGVVPSGFQTTVAFLNSTYAVALAGCIIYDGSLTQSGPTIDAATTSQQKAYYYVGSAADQQKRGATNGEAVGATNEKLGDISLSNPETRAATGKHDTSSSISSQASAGGDLSILDVILGGGVIGTLTDGVFQNVCPTFTNIYVATGGAVVLSALTLFPGYAAAKTAVTEAVEAGAKAVTTRVVTNIAAKSANKQAVARFNAKARFIGKDTLKSGAKVAGLTILAKLVVMSKSNSMNDGLEQNAEFANMADSGGNLHASNLQQRQFYGRPMTTSETAADLQANNEFMAASHKNDSVFERYLAASNPSSLVNRVATLTASRMNHSIFSSFLGFSSNLLTPLGSINNLFGSLFMPEAMAAASVNPTETFYGNVQWGYSHKEMELLRLDYTYTPLQNQKLLDASDKTDEIEAKYGECFDGSKTIGTMLAEGMIVRDADGNVEADKGKCSPNNLSSDNHEFGRQMVFRWRVSHNYNNGLDQLLDMQTVTDTPEASSGETPETNTTPDGNGIMVLFADKGRYDRAMIAVDTSKGPTVGGVPNTEASCDGKRISDLPNERYVINLTSDPTPVPCSASSFFVNFFKPGQDLSDRGPQNNNGRVSPSISSGTCTYVHRSGITRITAIGTDGKCPTINEDAIIEQQATKITAKYTPTPIIIGQAYTYEHALSLVSGDSMSPAECAGDIGISHIPDNGVGVRNYPMAYNPQTKTCTFKQEVTATYSAGLGPITERLRLEFDGNSYLKPTSTIINHERIRR